MKITPRCQRQERRADQAQAALQAERARLNQIYDRLDRWQAEADDASFALEIELDKRRPNFTLIEEAERIGARAERNAAKAQRDYDEQNYVVGQAQLEVGRALDALDRCRHQETTTKEIELTRKYRPEKKGKRSSAVDVTVRVKRRDGRPMTRTEGIKALSDWLRDGDLAPEYESAGVDWLRPSWTNPKSSSSENALQDFHAIFKAAGIGYVRQFAELRAATVDPIEEEAT